MKNENVIDTLAYTYHGHLKSAVRNQVFKPLIGANPGTELKKQLNVIKNDHYFVTDSTTIIPFYYGIQKLGALVIFEPEFESYFSGIAGAQYNQSNEWQVTGQMDFHLENLWKRAGVADILWKRVDNETQVFTFDYEDPYPFGLPTGVRLRFFQDFRRGLYLRNDAAVSITARLGRYGKWQIGIIQSKIQSSNEEQSVTIGNQEAQSVFLESSGDRRNNRWIPTAGFSWNGNFEIGNVNQDENSRLLLYGSLSVSAITRIFQRNYIRFGIWAKGSWIRQGQLHIGQKIRYGGVNTLRGYSEDILTSNWVIIPSIEFVMINDGSSEITFFYNVAVQDEIQPVPMGYGIGLSQVNKKIIFKISYGLNRNDTFKTGKLHLSIISRL
ncbi:MAG: BamA/TamA family outer membrane protein [Candidatus Neomarinimicrobiota bacterium]